MIDNRTTGEPEVLRIVIDALDQVDLEGRERILRYLLDLYGLDVSNASRPAAGQHSIVVNTSTDDRQPTFGNRETLPPKDFLHEKVPRTAIERVVCLAFYLTYFRDTPHFKTVDIDKLNTEAAQQKFSNPAQAVKDAIARGLVVPAGKGARQMSAIGERFVDALPDRENAKAVLGRLGPRRSRKKASRPNKSRKATK